MPSIHPFRGVRYSASGDVSHLVAPPYDVVNDDLRRTLLDHDSHNVVALELPQGSDDLVAPDSRYAVARATWTEWLRDGVIEADPAPAYYLVSQEFVLHGTPVLRRSLFAAVALHALTEGVIVPHERTLPKALGDRFNLITATHANFSPVFGMFPDPENVSATLFDLAEQSAPLAHSTDSDGVVNTLRAIIDPDLIERITALIAEKPVFIADGHHRYTVALAHRDALRDLGDSAAMTEAGPGSVLMALVNMNDPGLVVLPTHRVASAPHPVEAQGFIAALARQFDVSEPLSGHPAALLDHSERPAFVVRVRGDQGARLVTLKPDVDPVDVIPGSHSAHWKRLDVAIVQELVLSPLLDIHPDRPETLERLTFVKDAHEALEMVGDRDVAIIMRATRMDQLQDVALAGDAMPQKSTYFYPKLPSGLVFRDLSSD